ncbi:MAG: methylmalonyl Co-A mutase-associated GTPase MeaB [Bdellovibrionaceae bacterium]|nr:methylmalonyl Co-A mutase-associated GTPase MeaB [Bdellovibrionales bacterium]MCB9084863.1 methylmalonyl Co-A mutase-associated GTPase MeaB [Pseudobdellovibrionaceae bacterium]
MSDQIGAYIEKASAGKFADLARLLTLLEQKGASALENDLLLHPPQSALRVGITGPPGAGKSTLVGQLISSWRKAGARVGVLAVDPSSPFSGGAILGDRIRYSEHFADPGVFIRSLGSRGSLGGLSASAYLMLRAFDLWKFDVVLIETVGVGQTETDILHVADLVTLVLVPESGDSVQAMKAGLMEIADLFVVNKADRPGADSLAREIEFYFPADANQKVTERIFKTTATEGVGVEELAQAIRARGEDLDLPNHRQDPLRLRHEAFALLRGQWEKAFRKKADRIKSPEDLRQLLIENQL